MESEINLRDLLKMLWAGKWFISICTIAVILISGIFSFFVISPTYEANSSVRIVVSELDNNKQESYINSFTDSISSDVTLNKLADKLSLDKGIYTINSLRKNINIEKVKGANVVRLHVEGKESVIITKIANQLALDLASRIEVTDRSDKIVKANQEILQIVDKITVTEQELLEASKQLNNTSAKLTTLQTLSDEPYLLSVVSEMTNSDSRQLGALSLESEVINPVYIELKSTITQASIELAKLQTEKQNLEFTKENHDNRISEIEHQNNNEQLNGLSVERFVNGYNAVFIDPAIESITPIAPNKVMNILIAMIFGVMLGVVIVIVRQYWMSDLNRVPVETKINDISN